MAAIATLASLLGAFMIVISSNPKQTTKQLNCSLNTLHSLPNSALSPFEFDSGFFRYGYIDVNGNIIVQPTFTYADYFYENIAMVQGELEGGYGYINDRGCLQINYSRSHGPSIISNYGLISIYAFSHGLAAFRENDRYGFINSQGKVHIPAQYDYVSSFSEGLAAVSLKDKRGYINTKGKLVIPMIFADASDFIDGRAAVRNNSSEYFIDINGRALYNKTYKEIRSYREGIASVREGESYFANCIDLNLNGRSVSPPDFYCQFPFSEGITMRLELKENRYYINYVDRKFKNISNLLITLVGKEYGNFSEGLVTIPLNNKWGYMDKNGKLAIPAIFSSATSFRNGLARVNWVDSKGRSRIGVINHQRQIFYYEKSHLFSSEYQKKVCQISPGDSRIICDN
jgi:hypothetical protein